MRFAGAAFRAHDPRWAHEPLSGAGAAVNGGRFNRKGDAALYLALTLEGAIREASQGFAFRIPPLTIVEYEVDCADIVDLRDSGSRRRAGIGMTDLSAPWAMDLADRREPASWRVAARLRDEGAAGILVPSFARLAPPGLSNLILWRWATDGPHRVRLFDPDGRLGPGSEGSPPRGQS
ncbi:MAG: RES domain-containing protein [Bauldia sp.]|nr:RES domain-containing protein [Bauldia sp.]